MQNEVINLRILSPFSLEVVQQNHSEHAEIFQFLCVGVSRVIPRHPPFSMKEEALPACKETIIRNIPWSLRDRVMQQIWMYYKEKLTKNLADLNTFETSMSLRDRITS